MNESPQPETLLKFLEQEALRFGTLSEVRNTFRRLGPLILMTERTRYDLAKNSRRRRGQAKRAIAGVTGELISEIKTISTGKVTSAPDLAVLEPDCLIDMRCAVHYECADRLEYLFDRHIWQPLLPVIWEGVGRWIWLKLGVNSWNQANQLNRLVTLLYVGFTLAGANGKMRRLARWVELLPLAMPLGPLKGHPECWLMAVK
ncbi:MAG: hypothetical protein V1738_02580 [Patescibacteria group bacterium]